MEDLGTCMSRSLSHLLVSTMNLSTVARDCPATGVASSSCHRGRDHQGELGGDGSGRCVCMEVCHSVPCYLVRLMIIMPPYHINSAGKSGRRHPRPLPVRHTAVDTTQWADVAPSIRDSVIPTVGLGLTVRVTVRWVSFPRNSARPSRQSRHRRRGYPRGQQRRRSTDGRSSALGLGLIQCTVMGLGLTVVPAF
jgi:hypothetical protein